MNISVRYAPVLQSEFNGQDASLAYSCLLKLHSRTAEERDHQPTEGCVEKGRKEFLSNSAIHNLPDASAPGLDFSTTEKGADLLQDKVNANVALVESEKTSVICSLLLLEYIWLATGGKSQFNDRLMVLKGRKVTAFPDIDGYDEWRKKAKNYPMLDITISDILERNATPDQLERQVDIADVLLEEMLREK